MRLFMRKKSKDDEKSHHEHEKKKKLTAKEREAIEREARAHLPSRSHVGRNGIFEMEGFLSYVHAVGQVPGGQFVPISAVVRAPPFPTTRAR